MGNLNLILLTLSRVVGLVTNSAPLWKNNGKAPQVFYLKKQLGLAGRTRLEFRAHE
jgi:hypothetical protein